MKRRDTTAPGRNVRPELISDSAVTASVLAQLNVATPKPKTHVRPSRATPQSTDREQEPPSADPGVHAYKPPERARTVTPPSPPTGVDDPEWRNGRKAAIIEHLELSGDTIGYSARRCGVSRRALYKWRTADAAFDAAVSAAYAAGTENLEQEAKKRATRGTLRPVFHNGACVGHVRHKSDGLLKFLLMARDPRFRGVDTPPQIGGAMMRPGDLRMSRQDLDALPAELRDGLIAHMTARQSPAAL